MSRKLLLAILVLTALSISLGGDEGDKKESTPNNPAPTKADEGKGPAPEKASPASEKILKPLNLKQKIKVNANIDLPQDI